MRCRLAIAALLGVVAAAPTAEKRSPYTDADILNYALTLEHLENVFYTEALANYSQAGFIAAGFPNPFYESIQAVAADEAEHVAFITSALAAAGAPAVAQCTYSFPATTPREFAMLSAVIEGVGVSAYLGAAVDIMEASYLTAAAQIVPIEAHHRVYSLAAPFIVSCPSTNPALPVKAFPALKLLTTGTIDTGSTVMFSTAATSSSTLYFAFPSLNGPVFMPAMPAGAGMYSTTIPGGFGGQTYVILTTSDSALSDENTVAGPAIVECAAVLGGL